ncbi:MAG: ComF family protein [Candidatus Auribacterota bacterium]|nr:ComF family protein [Candidatus Auribacterota bacterium]
MSSALKGISLWIEAVENIVFPPHCFICEKSILSAGSQYVCSDCSRSLKALLKPLCSICGRPINVFYPEEIRCADCRVNPPQYDTAVSAVKLCKRAKALVHKFKYHGNFGAGKAIVSLMQDSGVLDNISADFLVPVPLAFSERFKRGFNQTEYLSKMISNKSGIPQYNILKKIRKTNRQTSLNRKQRLKNLEGVFEIKKGCKISGKRVLIVDDVYTTGATVNACATALKKAFPASIGVLTFARTLRS